MMNCRALFFGLGLALLIAPCASAAGNPSKVIDLTAGQTAGQMYIPVNKSQLLRVDRPFHEISVGNKEIADVQPLSRNVIYVLGKKMGTTNLTLRDANGHVFAVVDAVVTYDVEGLKAHLRELMPDEDINVTAAGNAIALSGSVNGSDHLRKILEMADHYAPGKVANMLTLRGSQQVMLEVKFAEVARTALKDLGVSHSVSFGAGTGDVIGSVLGTSGTIDGTATGKLGGVFHHGNWTIQSEIDALQKKGLVRTLAEPNLIALSGDTASFLAGGQFPVPVAQNGTSSSGTTTITVEYKDYGVGLAFTPTVIGKDLTNLVINSEVSSIDTSLSVTSGGVSVPALKTRRAKTTVELKDGQSFAIAGLLQDDFNNNNNQVPWLGDIPVLGLLFRSVNYQHNQTDLVIVITVHLIQPAAAGTIKTPLDSLKLPSEAKHFLVDGKLEDESVDKTEKPKTNQGYVLP
jgi:pilus assembly protein CpaC